MRQRSLSLIAVLSIALMAGCARRPDDAAIVTNIKSQMFSDPQLKNASVQVTSDKGQVTLSGTIPSDAARYDAYKIATQTAGVSKVNDQTAIENAQAAPPPAEPAPARAQAREPAHKSRASKKTAHAAPTESEFANNSVPPEPPAPVDQPVPAPSPAPQPAPPPVPALPPRHRRCHKQSKSRSRRAPPSRSE